MFILYIGNVFIDITLTGLSKQFALGFAKLGDKDVIKFRKTVILAVNNQVLVSFCISGALFFHQSVPRQQVLRDGRNPHKCFGIFGEKFKLACALENKYAAADVVGQFLALDFGERERRNERVGMRDFDEFFEVGMRDFVLFGKNAAAACYKLVFKLGYKLV